MQKPVSSLRARFEQMSSSQPSNAPVTKALSPQPTGGMLSRETLRPRGNIDGGTSSENLRGRTPEIDEVSWRPSRTASANHPPSPSPVTPLRQRPVSMLPPAVTILPPQSPPKFRGSGLTLSNTSAYLSTDNPQSATSGSPSPRHFRIPSRPITPHLEAGRSPRLSPAQPPSPPPPRRSGELRRESSTRAPPPINRADKPKIASKPLSLSFRNEATTLEPAVPLRPTRESSPFNTPPSSGTCSPENDTHASNISRRPYSVVETGSGSRVFEAPPVHHSTVTRRRDQETNGIGRGLSPQVTGDQRPALPARPPGASENVKARIPSGHSGAMMPPPPRPPVDTSRSRALAVLEETPTYATPPKRVFSTPTTQQHLETPSRSHGRSMTVDRTSDRTPVEFRVPPIASAAYSEPRQSPERSHMQRDPLPMGDYPDVSNSNRRPPYFKQGAREIATKYDTRILDVCGEFVCTTGSLTRVWSLVDGECVTSLAHTENIKICSVAFTAAPEIKDEGGRLWLGNNIGDIMEIDVLSQSVVTTKTNAHTRREIIRIYRHLDEMWSLDDGGTLHLWGPDNTGSPSLSNPSQSFRLPKGHSFSMVVGHELWHAVGKDIRIFAPTLDGSTQFQILQRPLSQSNAGDITSGTTISSQPDRVYFGHTDGKISIYSTEDYACLGIINVSIYKITALAGIAGHLWVGFSTGMIYVYDTTHAIWITKKDWQAHNDPVVKLIPDQRSCWTLDRAQVVSLGQDNMIRVWDGLLQEDWIGMFDSSIPKFNWQLTPISEDAMQSQEAAFCEVQSIKALVMTWNAGATTPSHLRQNEQDNSFFRNLIQSSDCPDIIVFGFQELVDLEDKKTVTSTSVIFHYQDHANKVQKVSSSHRRKRILRKWST